jgi:hypothetical protein
MEDSTPRRIVRQQARDLRHREHEGQVEEELERSDLLLVAVLELALGVGHGRTLAQRGARAGQPEPGPSRPDDFGGPARSDGMTQRTDRFVEEKP